MYEDHIEGFKSIFDEMALSVSTVFDANWYRDSQQLNIVHKSELLLHFLLVGFTSNASPTPLFDPSWYKDPVSEAHVSKFAFLTFIERGWAKGNNPHPLFDLDFYVEQIATKIDKDADPLIHFKKEGWRDGLMPHPLFDPLFYLTQNRVDLVGLDDPLSHYLRIGNKRGFVTSPHFDTAWYRAAYTDCAAAQQDALVEYVCRGFREGRKPNKVFAANEIAIHDSAKTHSKDPLSEFLRRTTPRGYGLPRNVFFSPAESFMIKPIYLSKISHNPLVSIIITNLNGKRHLSDLFNSLKRQTYRNFEIIFVDDGSSDNSIEEASKFGCDKVVPLRGKAGFASANNAGLAVARGELIALLNNDVRVQEGWLESLVNRMLTDELIGAVTSKVRFWGKFSRIRLSSKSEFIIDRRRFIENMEYKKFFLRTGRDDKRGLHAERYSGQDYLLELDIPIESDVIRIPLLNNGSSISVVIDGIPNRDSKVLSGDNFRDLRITSTLSHLKARSGFYVINNAGTGSGSDAMPYDRGIYEVDRGQYDLPQEIPYFCGCSVLIRRSALNGYKLFIDDFVAYFEDSELSLRLRRAGFKLYYEPSSMVEHRHSSTTVEHSAFWMQHTSKNSTLFRLILSKNKNQAIIEDERLRLNHMKNWYPAQATSTQEELRFAELVPDTISQMIATAEKIKSGVVPERLGTRIGLFNPYWSTFGGGEAHALNVINVIRSTNFVELISIEDFDIDALCDFFGIDKRYFIKRLVKDMTPELTGEYDIFVNSCYQSVLPSKASRSFYLVSFPSRHAPQDFISSYEFLANSIYTQGWMADFWSPATIRGHLIYPLVAKEFFFTNVNVRKKETIILSVGRFASSGHIKNQIEIAKTFKKLASANLIPNHWKLVLIGSVNDLEYVEKVKFILHETNYEIIEDADFETVADFYKKASIYVHASGFGQDLNLRPELAEHFGMAVAQAAAAACFPIVFNGAGPAEIVMALGIGALFDDLGGLEDAIRDRCEFVDCGFPTDDHLRAIVKAASIFDTLHFEARLNECLNGSKRIELVCSRSS